ncbi:MAG: DUF4276 family protein [Phycisphaerae bacterium]
MVEVVAIVEGRTEQSFIDQVLAEHLLARGVLVRHLRGGKSGKTHGVAAWESAKADILRQLKRGAHCTTMFDFYGLPNDWPGRAEASRLPPAQRAVHVESKVAAEIAHAVGPRFNPAQFIPYVQLHEFEALLFAGPHELATQCALLIDRDEETLSGSLRAVVAAGGPEEINDGQDTHPAARLLSICPRFKKAVHGVRVAAYIGIPTLRGCCEHFGHWLAALERLGQPAQPAHDRVEE